MMYFSFRVQIPLIPMPTKQARFRYADYYPGFVDFKLFRTVSKLWAIELHRNIWLSDDECSIAVDFKIEKYEQISWYWIFIC